MKNIAIVIGGSSGIGAAICDKLKDEYTVVNMSRRKHEQVDNIYCDVTSLDSVRNAFGELKKIYSPPYFSLIYCSGFASVQSIFELTEDDLKNTFETNVLGAFRVVQEYLKLSKLNNKIILIGSTSGMRASAGWNAYGSSKASLINFGLSLSEELKSYGNKVYIVSPGRTATPLRRLLAPNENPDTIMQKETVADFIYSLIQDEGLLDGQNLIVKKEVRI